MSTSLPPRADAEMSVGRNPHPDFKTVEASRPEWREDRVYNFTKTRNPDWKLGDGANDDSWKDKKHVEIDPYEEGRPMVFNYKLMISAIVPRPIAFISTRSEDGTSTNLSPFSYFQAVNHDPPLFTIGFAGGFDNPKDSLRNLASTKECTINIISENYIEAANATSINAPFGMSEWPVSGLHPAASKRVRPTRVAEAVFTVEATLVSTTEFESKATPGKKTGVLAVVEGVSFWAREDAINKEKNMIDPTVLRPMSRFGGISYGRTVEAIEIPRPDWEENREWIDSKGLDKKKLDEQ